MGVFNLAIKFAYGYKFGGGGDGRERVDGVFMDAAQLWM